MSGSNKLLAGKTALITGCSKGIGAEILHLFAAEGANIVACVRSANPEFITRMDDLVSEFGISVRLLEFDLGDEGSIKQAMQVLFAEKVKIDVLVNNAGVATGGFLNMTSIESMKNVFQINFFAPVLITQYVAKIMMRQRSGSIVNVGSIAGIDNFPGYTAYGSSKAALLQFTRIISNELAPFGIRVNSIAPALIDTNMAKQMEDKATDNMVGRSAMKRLGRPEEIANLALFLASDKSSFINGQTIRADGGM